MIDEIILELKKQYSSHGCSIELLNKSQEEQGVNYLPPSYSKFMLSFGDLFDILLGFSCNCGFLEESNHKQDLMDALQEKGLSLPTDAFVFFSHEGYVWHFFRTKENVENPPVYSYSEAELGIRMIAGSFTQLLRMSLSQTSSSKETFAIFYNFDPEKDDFYPIGDGP